MQKSNTPDGAFIRLMSRFGGTSGKPDPAFELSGAERIKLRAEDDLLGHKKRQVVQRARRLARGKN